MARIPYPDVTDSVVADLVEETRRARDGKLPMLFLMQMHNAEIFKAWLSLGTALRYRSSLDDRTRELAICMVSKLSGYDYQYDSHAPLAVEAGVDAGALGRLPSWRAEPAFDDRDRLLLEFTEALTRDGDVSEELFGRLGETYDPKKMMELTATVSFYGCGARFLKSLQIRSQDAETVPGLSPTTGSPR